VHEYALGGSSASFPGAPIDVTSITVAPDGAVWYLDTADALPHAIVPGQGLLATSIAGSATATAPTTLTVATFTDLSGNTDPSAYSATVTWSDGTTSPGTITPDSAGGFDVSVTHTFPVRVIYGIGSGIGGHPDGVKVTITDASAGSGGESAQAASEISVTNPPTYGTAVRLHATAGQRFRGLVGQFSNVDVTSSDYTATIDWGDGKRTTGRITPNAQGGFNVSGRHTFARAGRRAITVSLYLPQEWVSGIQLVGAVRDATKIASMGEPPAARGEAAAPGLAAALRPSLNALDWNDAVASLDLAGAGAINPGDDGAAEPALDPLAAVDPGILDPTGPALHA
jgi:hypothetical protein